MTKKLFLIAFALLIVCGAAFAQTEADFNVTMNDAGDGVVITKYTGRVAAVRIPATIQGMPVREIGKGAFISNSLITSVVIPQGVAIIGEDAFRGATKHVSVSIPE